MAPTRGTGRGPVRGPSHPCKRCNQGHRRHGSVVSVQVVRTVRRAWLLIIRRPWVRFPPAPPQCRRNSVRTFRLARGRLHHTRPDSGGPGQRRSRTAGFGEGSFGGVEPGQRLRTYAGTTVGHRPHQARHQRQPDHDEPVVIPLDVLMQPRRALCQLLESVVGSLYPVYRTMVIRFPSTSAARQGAAGSGDPASAEGERRP